MSTTKRSEYQYVCLVYSFKRNICVKIDRQPLSTHPIGQKQKTSSSLHERGESINLK